jgi:hypothetical protein
MSDSPVSRHTDWRYTYLSRCIVFRSIRLDIVECNWRQSSQHILEKI